MTNAPMQQPQNNLLDLAVRRALWLLRLERSLYALIGAQFLINIYLAPAGGEDLSIYANGGMIALGVVATIAVVGVFLAIAIYVSRIFRTSHVGVIRALYWVPLAIMIFSNAALVVSLITFNYAIYHYVAGDVSPDVLYAIAVVAATASLAAVALFDFFFMFSSAMFFAEARAKLFIAATVLFIFVLLIDILLAQISSSASVDTTSRVTDGFGLAWLIFVIAVRRYRKKLLTSFTTIAPNP